MTSVLAKKSVSQSRSEKMGMVIDEAQGIQIDIHKADLKVNPEYQRMHVDRKCTEIAKRWSWLACGVIVVGERNGEYWVIDGQHRVMAARKRREITTLPCIVFPTDTISQEAKGFLECNTNRKAVSSYEKYRAGLAAGDEKCVFIADMCNEYGVAIDIGASSNKPRATKCIGWLLDKARCNREQFRSTVKTAAELCGECLIVYEMLCGLSYIDGNVEGGLRSKRMLERLLAIGGEDLLLAAKKHARICEGGTAQVWAAGMLKEINKGLRMRFSFKE